MVISNCDCKLCCEGKLPGVESHLFSEFLLKEMVNMPGKANAKGKNYELLFSLSPTKAVDLYFGRNATQGALDFVGKDTFEEEEVEKFQSDENPLTDKFLVCSSCEKLFQPVENEFKRIYDKLTHFKGDGFPTSEEDRLWIELFLLMNIWRVSASSKMQWELEAEHHDCLTQILFHTFHHENGTLLKRFVEAKNTWPCLEVLCFFIQEEREDESNPNQNFFITDSSSIPYFFAINRLLIFISPNQFDGVSPPALCNGAINTSTMLEVINNLEKSLPIIEYSKAYKIHENCFKNVRRSYYEHVMKIYSSVYQSHFGELPSNEQLKEVNEIAQRHIKTISEYGRSEQELIKAIAEHLFAEAQKRTK
jgi:hypothetical protein